MLEKKNINRLITDNQKIEEIPNRDNQIEENEKEENDNNSFHQLLSLQLCIQKHSGLKELCKFNIY